MNKTLLPFLAPLFFIQAYALPLANPSEPSLLTKGLLINYCPEECSTSTFNWLQFVSLRLGYSGNFVFNRHLDQINTPHRRDIDTTKINDNAVYLALNFCERVDCFATFGLSSFTFESAAVSFDNFRHLGQRIELETKNGCSWSVGGRAVLVEMECFTFGIEGQYYQTSPRLDKITLMQKFSESLDNQAASLHYNEWQIGCGVSYQVVNWMVPYVGITYAQVKGSFDELVVTFHDSPLDTLHFHDLHAPKKVGYALGVSLIACDAAALTVEGRFVNEKSAFVNAQLRF